MPHVECLGSCRSFHIWKSVTNPSWKSKAAIADYGKHVALAFFFAGLFCGYMGLS